MTQEINLKRLPPGGEHASEEEYRAYLTALNFGKPRDFLRTYRWFLSAYPDLDRWPEAPLLQRVQELAYGVPTSATRRPLKLKPYLLFLVNTGRARLDWPWILSSGKHPCRKFKLPEDIEKLIERLASKSNDLGISTKSDGLRRWIKYLHMAGWRPDHGLESGITEAISAVRAFSHRPDLADISEPWTARWLQIRAEHFHLQTVAYHAGLTSRPPNRCREPSPFKFLPPERMAGVIEKYVQTRLAQGIAPKTASRIDSTLRRLAAWAANRYGHASFSDLTRDQVLEYIVEINGTSEKQISSVSTLNVFFRDITGWGWEEAPSRPLIAHSDIPKRVVRLPRYIPAGQLERLLTAIRQLDCPLQKAALLTARWSGARRNEIRWLEIDCLDQFPDGTPRLRIPAGKTRTERSIPLHPEAAEALKALVPAAGSHRPYIDERGHRAKRLFVKAGRLCTNGYLFEQPLHQFNDELGIKAADNMPVTSHRFRHTVGTELAEGGARLHTIMKMLGHTSTGMTLVYAHISDQALKSDYMKVLGPGAAIAGPIADTLRAGTMAQPSIDWLKKNFFRTELELGHCLRLPEEGPCECDLYLSCAKFVTTPAYVPRLKERRACEQELIEAAKEQGWSREVERHECTVRRIDQLLAELGEAAGSMAEPPRILPRGELPAEL